MLVATAMDNLTVTGNTFLALYNPTDTTAILGVYANDDLTNSRITDNVFPLGDGTDTQHVDSGMYLITPTDLNITGNTFNAMGMRLIDLSWETETGKGLAAVELDGGENVRISGNTMLDGRTAIWFEGNNGLSGNGPVLIYDNNMDNNAYAIEVGDGTLVASDVIEIYHNNITQTLAGDYAVANWDASEDVNATLNYFGVTTYAAVFALTDTENNGGGTVLFEPWRSSATEDSVIAASSYSGWVSGDGNVTVTGEDIVVVFDGAVNMQVAVGAPLTIALTSSTYSTIDEYVDVEVISGTADELYITVDYLEATIEAAGLTEDTLVLYWLSDEGGANEEWLPVSDSGVNTTGNYVWARITSTSSPTIAELTGTAFGPGDAVDKGDTLDVTGTGVTSGSLVNVYWDAATGSDAQLLNTTEANPDGSWDLQIDVPSDVAGLHFIWVETVDNTWMYSEVLVVQKVSVSPSSGLVGDEITVSGYGYSAESEITISFNGTALTTSPSTVETDELGYFTATIDVPARARGRGTSSHFF